MHRTQILLEEWQYRRLKSMAERDDRSLGSLVREAVDRYLDKPPASRPTRVSDIAGIGRDETSGRDHDDQLYRPRR